MAYKNNMSDIEVVGRNLEFERLRLNMTIKEFSHQISYDRGSYSKLVRLIIPGLSEPPVRTLRATCPENESHIFR